MFGLPNLTHHMSADHVVSPECGLSHVLSVQSPVLVARVEEVPDRFEPTMLSTVTNVIATEWGDPLLPARYQMALTLGSHIVLACFGMALPAMIFVLHRRGLNGDDDALELAHRWSKVAGVLFAIGAASGTILSFEMGLLWPGLMEQYGDVIGLAFALEAISFFTEAIFLGLYLYGWGRLPERLHSLMLLPIVGAGVVGSFFVVSVNAWMNNPTGFDLANGRVVNVDPVAAIFNDAVWVMFLHMFVAAYMVTGFMVASVYAAGILRGNRTRFSRIGIIVPLAFAGVAAMVQPVIGHFAGQSVADRQPIKLAAIEGLTTTETSVPLVLGGVYVDGELRGGITVPIEGLGSFLAQNDFDAELAGLDSVPPADRPPAAIVRLSFQVMVALGTALAALAVWAAIRWRRRRAAFDEGRAFLLALTAAGPASIIALETGWITTEVGRQPWVVDQLLRTADAVTDSEYILATFVGIVVVYGLIGVAGIALLRSMARRWAAGETDLASPYGPLQVDGLDGGAQSDDDMVVATR